MQSIPIILSWQVYKMCLTVYLYNHIRFYYHSSSSHSVHRLTRFLSVWQNFILSSFTLILNMGAILSRFFYRDDSRSEDTTRHTSRPEEYNFNTISMSVLNFFLKFYIYTYKIFVIRHSHNWHHPPPTFCHQSTQLSSGMPPSF